VVYDPAAMDQARQVLGKNVEFASSLEDCCKKADLILITTPWSEFKAIFPEWLKGKTVIDCWKILDSKKFDKKVKYIAVGINPKNEK